MTDTTAVKMPLSCAILAGGRSSRMGRDKALVEVDGRALALRVADALRRAGADPVAAVGGDLPALARLGLADRVTEVLDPTWLLPAVGALVDARLTFVVIVAAYLLSGPVMWARAKRA